MPSKPAKQASRPVAGARIRIQDVARMAQVSLSTVSGVLNEKSNISPETRVRVLDVIAQLGYTPNLFASNLARRKTKIIGIIVSDLLNPFFGEIAQVLDQQARERGFETFLTATDFLPEKQTAAVRQMLSLRVAGIAMMTSENDPEAFFLLKSTGTPAVYLDNDHKSSNIGTVRVDKRHGMFVAVQHLLELMRISTPVELVMTRLFAVVLAGCIPFGTRPSSATQALNPRRFGAVADGRTKDTAAIQKALDACDGETPCEVLLDGGTFVSAPLVLHSHTALHIAAGAVLPGSSDHADYPKIAEMRAPTLQPLLSAHDAQDITIEGGGAIEGNGASWWSAARAAHDRGIVGEGYLWPKLIVISHSQHLRFDHITIRNSPGPDAPSANITIADCIFLHGHGLSIGSELSGCAQHIFLHNIRFDGTDNGLHIKANRDRGSDVSDIHADRLTMKNVKIAFLISEYYPQVMPSATDQAAPIMQLTPFFHDIAINDLHADNSKVAGYVLGLPESPVKGVTLTDVNIDAQYGLTIGNAQVQASGLQIHVSDGEPIIRLTGALLTQTK